MAASHSSLRTQLHHGLDQDLQATIVDGANAGKSTTTGSAGSYTFTGLVKSGFTVNVTASGYVASSKGISLTSNQTLAFPLTKVVASTFTLNGIVTDGTSGGILPGIRVSITSGTNAGKSSTTDSSGNYAFTGVAAGTLTISGSATSYTTVDKSVTVTGNTRLDFVLPRIAAAPAPSPSPAPGGLGTGAFLSLGTDSTTCRCWNSPITFKINGTSAATLSCSGSAKVAVAPGTYTPQACDSIGCVNLTSGSVGAGQEQGWTIFCSSNLSVRSETRRQD